MFKAIKAKYFAAERIFESRITQVCIYNFQFLQFQNAFLAVSSKLRKHTFTLFEMDYKTTQGNQKNA